MGRKQYGFVTSALFLASLPIVAASRRLESGSSHISYPVAAVREEASVVLKLPYLLYSKHGASRSSSSCLRPGDRIHSGYVQPMLEPAAHISQSPCFVRRKWTASNCGSYRSPLPGILYSSTERKHSLSISHRDEEITAQEVLESTARADSSHCATGASSILHD